MHRSISFSKNCEIKTAHGRYLSYFCKVNFKKLIMVSRRGVVSLPLVLSFSAMDEVTKYARGPLVSPTNPFTGFWVNL